MNNNFHFFIILLFLSLTSCYDNVDSELKPASVVQGPSSEITGADFLGAIAANNKVTGIEIAWSSATKEVSGYKVYRVQGKDLNLLATLPANVTGYIDGTAWWGTIYAYVVRAVDRFGIEDTNTKQVSALSWAGIRNIEAVSRTSIKIHMEAATAIADEIRIYIHPTIGIGDKILAATVSGSELEIPIENLKTGFGYKISAQAYVNSLKKEDGNDLVFTVNTNSYGYHYDGADFPKWNSIVNIRAFGESPGTSPHPIDADKSPSDRLVEISFNSFLSMSPTTKYVVIRAKEGYTLDTSTNKSCTSQEVESCKACELTGTGVLTCKDYFTAASPMRYRYTLAMVNTEGTESWVEAFPQDQIENFSILVPIPPANMVLVQRDAVNYEMCQLMNKISDPINHNRCIYGGTGAIPYSTGHNKPPLNLPSGFYDFGYNLFVDRYPLGCNWTRASSGGKCGAGATDGDCLGITNTNAYPSNTIGVDGNVFWGISNECAGATSQTCKQNVCFQKVEGAWKRMYELQTYSEPEKYYKNALTNDPAAQNGQRPYLADWSSRPIASNLMCNAFVDPSYGMKRIPRMREHIAFYAWPSLPTDSYFISLTTAQNYLNGVSHDSGNGYRCFNYGSASEVSVSSIANLLTPGNYIVNYKDGTTVRGVGDFLGSPLSSDCQSRYGVRLSNGGSNRFPVSDYFYYETTPSKRLVGGISLLDNGNTDLLYDVYGGPFGYKIAMADVGSNVNEFYSVTNNIGSHNFMNMALGLPVFLTSSSDYLAKALVPVTSYGSQLRYAAQTQTQGPTQIEMVGRFSYYLRPWNSTLPLGSSTRCVLPAE